MSLFKKYLVAALLLAAIAAGAFYYWANAPLRLTPAALDVTIKPHSSLRSVSLQLRRGGVPVHEELFVIMTQLLGLSTQLKSGNYEFKDGVSPYQVLQKIARGDVNEYVVTVIEGWTLKRMRAEIDQNAALRHDSLGMSDAELLHAIGVADQSGEGLFFPDTYLFDKNTSDLDIYRRAHRLAQKRLEEAWVTRAPNLPYKTPYDALTMASIVEKETGKENERPLVAAVFVNRLRLGMPLQTDPSVIYGLGTQYDGHLTKRDLQTDTPYNTYTHLGLPPTPISLPGMAALLAATSPAQSSALYFVSRGDGTSFFSDNLSDHNKAVNKYIRGQGAHEHEAAR